MKINVSTNQTLMGIFVVSFIGIYAYFSSIGRSFPFYFAFDMDQIVTLDTALILSGHFPEHIYHTTFGVYLITSSMAKLAYLFNMLPFLDIKTLSDSINPYFVIAQFTDFFRLLPPFICSLIVLLWSMIFLRILDYSFSKILILILCLATSPGLIWQASLIKSEQISLMFWLIGFYLMTFAIPIDKDIKNRINSPIHINYKIFFISGIFLGLGFITKVQSFLFLVLLYFSLFYFFLINNFNEKIQRKKIFIAIPAFNLCLFLLIYFFADLTKVSSSITGAVSYGINLFSALYISIILLNLLIEYFYINKLIFLIFIFRLFSLLNLGILFSFFLHFLIYKNISNSITYFLYDFKMVFLRRITNDLLINEGPSFYLQLLIDKIALFPFLFLAFTILVLSTLLSFSKIKHKKWTVFIFLIFIFNTFINILFIVRNTESDLIWLESSLYLLIFICFYSIKLNSNSLIKNKLFPLFYFFIFSLILLSNIQSNSYIKESLKAHLSLYGWLKNMSLGPVYGGNHIVLVNAYENNFTIYSKPIAWNLAENYKDFYELAEFPFQNKKIQIDQVGIFNNGFRIWNSDRNSKITEPIPPYLRNAALVNLDLSADKPNYVWAKNNNFKPEFFRENMEIKNSNLQEIPILYRPELNVYLITEKKFSSDTTITPCEDNVYVESKNIISSFFCYKIEKSTILKTTDITGKYFFAIRKKAF